MTTPAPAVDYGQIIDDLEERGIPNLDAHIVAQYILERLSGHIVTGKVE